MITLADTTRAVTDLKELGLPVTLRSVRERLGTGSFTTLGSHFRKLGLIVDPAPAAAAAESYPTDPDDFRDWAAERVDPQGYSIVNTRAYISILDELEALKDAVPARQVPIIDEVDLAELRRAAGTVPRLKDRIAEQDRELEKLAMIHELLNRSDPADVVVAEARRLLEG